MPFTYKPKIDRVWNGEITQTIREKRETSKPKKIGDNILFHTWEGRPYRSKWGRRLLTEIIDISEIKVFDWGIINGNGFGCNWNAPGMDRVARLDGICPPTGDELKRVLFDLNGSEPGKVFQIITWKIIEDHGRHL